MEEQSVAIKGEGVRNQFFAALIVNLLIFCHGCEVGWISPLLLVASGEDNPLWSRINLEEFAWIGSLLCVGAFAGTPVYGWLVDKVGRKKTAMLTGVPILAGWVIKFSYRSATGLMAARFINGFGSAGGLIITSLYSVEVASPSTRGVLGSFTAFSINGGILLMYVIGAYLSYNAVSVIMICIPIVFFIFMLVMPETPIYLIKNNRDEEARKAIAWLRSIPKDSPAIDDIMKSIKYDTELANGKKDNNIEMSEKGNCEEKKDLSKSSWHYLFTSLPTFKAFSVCFSLITVQCFIGVFAVLTYANAIFEEAGSTLSATVNSLIVAVLQIIGSVVASSVIEKTGRKILLIVSCSTVALSMFGMGTYFYLKSIQYDTSTIEWLPVSSASLTVSMFAIGIGPVPYIIPAELIMVQARGLATTIMYMWLWLLLFLVAQFYNQAAELLGVHTVFCGFGIVACLGVLITILFLPETRGKSFESILEYYGEKTNNKIEENNTNNSTQRY